jgi:hypothetical protein
MEKCISCGEKLKYSHPEFTGVDNYKNGQYIKFQCCDNKKCIRYKLYCGYSISENDR